VTPSVSIIIPARDHARYLGAAVASATAQTRAAEVVVVDDGSTDDTPAVLSALSPGVVVVRHPEPLGVAAARNTGIRVARGELLMFLDADDTIEPAKAEAQVAALAGDPAAGWSYCDVNIVDDPGPPETWTEAEQVWARRGRPLVRTTTRASRRYDYARRRTDGWLYGDMVRGNFVPFMAPLVRRRALDEAGPFNPAARHDDWDLLLRLSAVAPARYVPHVLGTYWRRRTGRHARPDPRPGVRGFLRPDAPDACVVLLNLGCGAPGLRSWHPMPGFVNLDKRTVGWTFESGLGDYRDGLVYGITVSHALGCVAESHYPAVCREFARVLRPGGVVRVTDGDLAAFGRLWDGTDPYATLIGPDMVARHLDAAGLEARVVGPEETSFSGPSLVQRHHPSRPGAADSFHVEGVKRVA